MVQKNCLSSNNDGNKPKILIICGATATSKTALAVECARLLDSAVISADSMNVYSKLNIGTAKPTLEEKKGVKHYLIDVVSPQDTFSVGDYKEMAEPIINDLISNGKIPVICGGTGFYINSILYDLSYGNGEGNLELREYYKGLAEKNGNLFVYDILKEKDAVSAEKIHPNDIKRVIRALEIFDNGIKKSAICDEMVSKYDYSAYCIDFDRNTLYERINKRVDQMFENGLVSEVQRLLDEGITLKNQCMQGIGYKEIAEVLINSKTLTNNAQHNENSNDILDISEQLESAKELIKLNTRHYAKRQITFFKKLPNLIHLEPISVTELAKGIVEKYD